MKKGNKMNTAALLYMLSSIIWLVVAGINIANGQPVFVCLNVVLAVLCLIFAKRKMNEKK